MTKRVRCLGIAIIVSLAGFVGAAGAGAGVGHAFADGNEANAQLCQQGGYLDLVGTDGVTDTLFNNTGDCVSFAAQGGLLAPAMECLNNGYLTLAPEGSNTPFASEVACVLYIAEGGTPHQIPTTSLTATVTGSAGSGLCDVTITGKNLLPGSFVFYNGTLGGQVYQGQVIGAPAVGADGTLNATNLLFASGFSGTLTATTSSGQAITAPIAVVC